MNKQDFKKLGLAVIQTEASAIEKLSERINDDFNQACDFMLHCSGRIIVLGMGKSGHIGSKIAATLASTGSPAFFVHPGEASHGDLGMITPKDVVLAISSSGETSEILTILPIIKRLNAPLISLTGKPDSTLAKAANINIDVHVEKEACPLGLAPTSSTTATLVMGDALAIALLEARGFTEQDFARSHPGGNLGRKLLLLIEDIMHAGDEIPHIHKSAKLKEALLEITQKGLGMTVIVDEDNRVTGVFTDGDLRRALDNDKNKDIDIHNTVIEKLMTPNCRTINADMLAAEALQLMDKYKINALPVTDQKNRLIGAINMHDLLRAGVV